MFRDQLHDALQAAAAPTLERIRRYGAHARGQLKKLFGYLEEHLFDPQLDAQTACREAGVNDHRLLGDFKTLTGLSLKKFITVRRIRVARRLVHGTNIRLGRISFAVGYPHISTFRRCYERVEGHPPAAVRNGLVPRDPDGPLRLDHWKEWDTPTARTFLKEFLSVHRSLRKELRPRGRAPEPEYRAQIDGARHERWYAEGLWQEIRNRAPIDQELEVRRHRFASTALFDVLRRRSRLEGRRDPQRGIQIAELALVSLDDGDGTFGERIHDLRALGWAWLGNAYRIANDLPAADTAFERADEEWRTPREHRDDLVLARICNLEGTLRMFQRSYDQALKLVDRSRDLCRLGRDGVGEARALIQKASVLGYAGKWQESIKALQKAEEILEAHEEPYLMYAVVANQANLCERAGKYQEALAHLARANELCSKAEHPLGWSEIQAYEGAAKYGLGEFQQAEGLWLGARQRFAEAGATFWVALIDLRLAQLFTEQGDVDRVLVFSSEAVPLMERMRLHDETVAAVALLSRAIEAREIAPELLKNVCERLQQDPLARLS